MKTSVDQRPRPLTDEIDFKVLHNLSDIWTETPECLREFRPYSTMNPIPRICFRACSLAHDNVESELWCVEILLEFLDIIKRFLFFDNSRTQFSVPRLLSVNLITHALISKLMFKHHQQKQSDARMFFAPKKKRNRMKKIINLWIPPNIKRVSS